MFTIVLLLVKIYLDLDNIFHMYLNLGINAFIAKYEEKRNLILPCKCYSVFGW